MSSWRTMASLYQGTVDSITAQPGWAVGDGRTEWPCGCVRKSDGLRIWLCLYHHGYEDGIGHEERPAR